MSEDREDYVPRDVYEKVKQESISRKERIRELEPQVTGFQNLQREITNIRVENELLRRGVQAEPEWVRVPEDGNIPEAVDNFITKFPHLAPNLTPQASEPETNVIFGDAPRVMPVDRSNPHTPGPAAQGSMPLWETREGLDKIEKDPALRKTLQEQYHQWARE